MIHDDDDNDDDDDDDPVELFQTTGKWWELTVNIYTIYTIYNIDPGKPAAEVSQT